MHTRCQATTKDGEPCKGTPLPGYEHCFNHAPHLAERRKQAQRNGGRARSNEARAAARFSDKPLSTNQLISVLSRAVRRAEAGDLEPNIANSLAGLARAISSIRETAQLEERLEQLERDRDLQAEALGNLRKFGGKAA